MKTNDQVILSKLLDQWPGARLLDGDNGRVFELFTAEQIIKDYELSWDELESGIIGGGNDGGIDSFYLFVNGILVREDSRFNALGRYPVIDLYLIQSKRSGTFSEGALHKFQAASRDLFVLEKDLSSLKATYNEMLISLFRLFRRTYNKLIPKLPKLGIHFRYATLGSDIHPNVTRQSYELRNIIEEQFSDVTFSFQFLGARELLSLARRRPPASFELTLADSPIASDRSYVALVTLREFAKFIGYESGALLTSLFEANVRDYQGNVQVNQAIRETLGNPQGEDFWWLNNGITMVADKAHLSGKKLTLENPQIVNGLQTSVEIFEHFINGGDDEGRCVLLRVIEPRSEEGHQRVIRATNSQTSIPLAFLRATDEIHRDIETYFQSRGLYYDRRKNYYKNQGRSRDAIIGIPFLAQAIMAVLLGRPNDARARPSTLLKDEAAYRDVFNPKYPPDTYVKAVQIVKVTESYLRLRPEQFLAKEINNLKFHLAYFATRLALGRVDVSALKLASLETDEVERQLEIAYGKVSEVYRTLGADDKVAKGREFVVLLSEQLTPAKLAQ